MPEQKKPTHRLDDETVYEIKRQLYIARFSQGELAKQYGITQGLVSQIKLGKTWKRIWFSPTPADRRERNKLRTEREDDLAERRKAQMRLANKKWYRKNKEYKKEKNREYLAQQRENRDVAQDQPA